MGVQFNQIPANLRVPLFYAEVNSGLSPYQGQSRLLLIGQRLSTGSAVANVPVPLNGEPNGLFGAGSMLADMALYARQNHPLGEIWCLPLADPSGVAQTWTVTIAVGILGSSGLVHVGIGNERVSVAVAPADTNVDVATAIAAAVGLGYSKFGKGMSHPVTASASSNVVTLTARHVGAVMGKLSIVKALNGDEGELQTHVTIAAGTTGTGTPALSTAIAALGDVEYDWIAAPYADTTSLNTMRDFLGNSGRWGPLQQLFGHYITALFDSYANLISFGSARNNPNESIMGVVSSPSSPWVWAAALGAVVAVKKNLGAEVDQAYEISRPLHTLELVGVRAPLARTDWWDITERQGFYNDGISAFRVTVDGRVVLDRVVTTYQVNDWSQPDITWLDIESRAQMVYIIRYLRQRVSQEYGRHALADDNPGNNPAVATPKRIKATFIAAYRELEFGSVTEKTDIFAGALVVERSTDPNRVNAYLPIDVVNQLRVIAVNATTFLTFPQTR